MDIYIYKNGQQQGPYNEQVIRSGLTSGQFVYTDYAWYSGMTEWVPLSQIMNAFPDSAASDSQELQPSALGRLSFIFAMATFVLWFILIVLFAQTRGFRNIDEFIGLVIFLVITCIMLNIAGVVFGIIGSIKSCSNKWMAIVGMIVNTIGFFGIFGLID